MNIRFYRAKILCLLPGHHFRIEEGELWVKGQDICYIGDGKRKQIVKQRENIIWDREIDAHGNLLMPGFKDAHTHTAMTFLRSYADDLPLQKWLNELVFPNEAKLRNEDIYPLNVLGIMEYLTSGITADFDMYPYPYITAKAAADCGFRSVITSGFNDFVSSVSEMEEQYYKLNETDGLISFIPGFHAEYTTSLSNMEELSKLVNRLKAPVWTHNSETEKEVSDCKKRYGKTPTQIMEALGLYEYGGGGYHCIWFEDEDFRIFKRHGMSMVTNPASNLKLASGVAPLKRFVQEGINIGIGTDGPASNNCLDMFREMFLTAGLAKLRERDAACIPAEEILYMAVTGGAHAMGLLDCDCLEEGKKADLIMIDLSQPNMQPQNNIISNLVYSGSKQNVMLTMIDGKILYENGRFLIGQDTEEIYRQANAVAARMK